MRKIFTAANILLPRAGAVDLSRWACVACDQYTSEADYWEREERLVGDQPSAYRLILPEIYLGQGDASRIDRIHETMKDYLSSGLFTEYTDAMIYLERTLASGEVRRGVVGKIDLECYDYAPGAQSPVRPTEGTVLERIPPRVAVRRGAPLELPHVMLLIDEADDTILSRLSARAKSRAPIYDFDLAQASGHARGYLLTGKACREAEEAFAAITDGIVFAVGDGNHSLASAAAYYAEIRASLGEAAARRHPARYALVEVVNIHDPSLVFEPIYRLVTGVDPRDLLDALVSYRADCVAHEGSATYRCVGAFGEECVTFSRLSHPLAVGTLQNFLDAYLASHPRAKIDYIHGEETLCRLAAEKGAVGFLFDGMQKSELFPAVAASGALPRKTFSMGEACDKRFYIEARQIQN